MAIESTLGWIAIDPTSVGRIRTALDMSDQGVVDELGVGILHTGYADQFFPGTSVLQTRARYVFFVPWTFLHLAKKKVRGDALKQKKRDVEHVVTGRLIAHFGEMANTVGQGIIGVRVHPKAPAQPPDFVYWTAMNTWGFHTGRPRSSLLNRWSAQEVLRAAEAKTVGDEAIELEHLAIFDVPHPPEGWPGEFAGGFDLTVEEAEWLRARWQRMHAPSEGQHKALAEGAGGDDERRVIVRCPTSSFAQGSLATTALVTDLPRNALRPAAFPRSSSERRVARRPASRHDVTTTAAIGAACARTARARTSTCTSLVSAASSAITNAPFTPRSISSTRP